MPMQVETTLRPEVLLAPPTPQQPLEPPAATTEATTEATPEETLAVTLVATLVAARQEEKAAVVDSAEEDSLYETSSNKQGNELEP